MMSRDTLSHFHHTKDQFQIRKEVTRLVLPHTNLYAIHSTTLLVLVEVCTDTDFKLVIKRHFILLDRIS
jgi:hypothetical protein